MLTWAQRTLSPLHDGGSFDSVRPVFRPLCTENTQHIVQVNIAGVSIEVATKSKSKNSPKRMRPTPFVSGWNLHHISNQLCRSLKNDKANFALDFQGEKMKSQRCAYLSSENFVSSTRWRRFRIDTVHISAAVTPWHREHGYRGNNGRFHASS